MGDNLSYLHVLNVTDFWIIILALIKYYLSLFSAIVIENCIKIPSHTFHFITF